MAELDVSRKTISKLLSELQNKKFVIPDYQRPYKWDSEKCETLWNDITAFFSERAPDDEYFLGTIVTCKSPDNNNEIELIDGQQRITSILLLLRAFYKKLEKMEEDENIIGLKSQIAPCIWDVDPISRKVKDTSRIHIESRVATESDNSIFHDILSNGYADASNKDLYSINYNFFLLKCEEYARDFPIQWQPLCVTILEKCIILPIECNTIDTALTIFSTLNDRGMPLSDSDIFKAQIYKSKEDAVKKKEFSEEWKELSEIVDDAKIELNDLFRYYSHLVRARNADRSREIGLRKFFSLNNYSLLKNENIMPELRLIADFWLTLNSVGAASSNLNYDSLKFLHCLRHYPNDYWKFITTVYFFKHKENPDFPNMFAKFLEKLTAFLFARFIEKPTVNAIKGDIYQACIDIWTSGRFSPVFVLPEDFQNKIKNSYNWKIAKAIILLQSYLNPKQNSILPENFEIEHIFPRAWQETNYHGWERNDAALYLERYGNKVAIEKKVNIQAGNGYFGRKKDKYAESKIAEVRDLSRYHKNDWVKEDIEIREETFINTIQEFFIKNLSDQ